MRSRSLISLFFLVSLVACGDSDPPTDVVPEEDESDVGVQDVDEATPDAEPNPVDTGMEIDEGEDVPVEDLPMGTLETGELCEDDSQCISELCLFLEADIDQGLCSDFCFTVEDCPDDQEYDCVFFENSGSDGQNICVPSDLCIDFDEDDYGFGPGCEDRDCDDEDPNTNPAADEVCDDKDNDCDGNIDDDPVDHGVECSTGLPGVCAAGVTFCDSGTLLCEQRVPQGAEFCDNLDNDCDGDVDEGEDGEPLAEVCYNGSQETIGVGECRTGLRVCTDGRVSDCIGQVTPIAELCDGLDNDCDDEIDEENPGEGVLCDTGELGVCARGQTRCVGDEVFCEPINEAVAEVCDERDNDCDGEVDEDEEGQTLTTECYDGPEDTADVGTCVPGLRTCAAGQFGNCQGQVVPEDELCDTFDNDCDGVEDEGNPAGGFRCDTGLLGVCSSGETRCTEEGTLCVPSVEASQEVCDGRDNDCDGDTDEDGQGELLSRACYNGPEDTIGLGLCVEGAQVCRDGLFGVCEDEVIPSVESCDGRDNDCDDEVDEGNPGGNARCETGGLGRCALGLTRCTEDGLVCDQQNQPVVEVCDGLDNDCDGAEDEDEEGEPLAEACYDGPEDTAGQGLCRVGVKTCFEGQPGACEGQVLPATDICDGVDNDCDGQADEGNPGGGAQCDTGALGLCGFGLTQCLDGEIVCVQTNTPSEETCDGLDNDCDGAIDEDSEGDALARGCYDGPEGTANQGLCRLGAQTCADGQFGACVGQVLPGNEVCDGDDNDCDGAADEDNPGGNVQCETGALGLCGSGITACAQGQLECEALFVASAESCDGADNDCDGEVDEDEEGDPLTQSCYDGAEETQGVGVCTAGLQRCAQGQFGACLGQVLPGNEVCDGEDNDCDGSADENNPGANIQCDTGQEGVCSRGLTLCDSEGVLQCNRVVEPSAESCDGRDNDCDGESDEDAQGDALQRACYAGPDGTAGVGQCEAGVELCAQGQFGACLGQTLPSVEVCDGEDNDCNGADDDGNPGGGVACDTGLEGVCSGGVSNCEGGDVLCQQVVESGDEVCDGLDNDCDGARDEDFLDLGQTCTAGLGVCRRVGVLVCDADDRTAQPVCDAEPGPRNEDELCDFNDDDCDGEVDEDFRNEDEVYDTVENCGSCGINCNNQWPGGAENFNVNPTCLELGDAAQCDFDCVGGFVDLDDIPDNGCEFLPDPLAVYVSTPGSGGDDDDLECGTFDAPCGSISNGILRAQALGAQEVLVSDGLFRENIVMVDGINVLGGHNSRSWQRDFDVNATVLSGTTPDPQSADRVVVTAAGITVGAELSGLTINGENSAPGGNSIGIYVLDSTEALVIRNNLVFAASGGDGARGDAGARGVDGADGFDGSPNQLFLFACAPQDVVGSPGGGNFCEDEEGDTLNVSGGRGGVSNCPDPAGRNGEGQPGQSVPGPDGDGGAGGIGAGHLLATPSTCQVNLSLDPAPGLSGGSGTDGAGGLGAADPDGSIDVSLQWRGLSGERGTSGDHGGGGGGGGSAPGVDALDQELQFYYGATGGGGGSGGCQGRAGFGGGAGGASFAVFVTFSDDGPSNSDEMPQVFSNRFARGQGGQGGVGGAGGAGGDSGFGGAGGSSVPNGEVYDFCMFGGAIGGRGGRGGHGGGGGGGAGGVSFDLYVHNNNDHQPDYSGTNDFVVGAEETGGQGGTGGTSNDTEIGLGEDGPGGSFGTVIFVQ